MASRVKKKVFCANIYLKVLFLHIAKGVLCLGVRCLKNKKNNN